MGDDVFHWTVDQSTLSRQYRGDRALVHGARLGHLLFITIGGKVVAIDSRQDTPAADGDVLWPNRSTDEFTPTPATRGADWRPLRREPAGRRSTTARHGRQRIYGAAGNAGGSLGPATPRGVVFQDSDDLRCVDPLSGAIFWSRSDVPIGCELFGDEEFVFAADISNHVAYVVRVSDGELLGKREIPKLEWLLTAGRNVAQVAYGNKKRQSRDDDHRYRYLVAKDCL